MNGCKNVWISKITKVVIYKCVNLVRVLYRGKKQVIFRHMKVPCKNQPCRRGSAPYRRSDWTSRLWAMSKPGQFKTTRCARALSLLNMAWLSWISELSGTPGSYASRFRNCALQCAPVRWTLASEPTIWRSLRPCQSRNITEQTNPTTAEQRRAFPVTFTQRFQRYHVLPTESPLRSTNWPRETRNKELNSRRKRNQKATACLKQRKQVSSLFLIELVKLIWRQ